MAEKRVIDCGIEDTYIIHQASHNLELIKFTLCGITYPYPNYLVQRNRSITMCIEYVESGAGVICADNKRYYPVGGDTYILHINENQRYWADHDNPWKKYWVNISGINCKKLVDFYKLGSSHHFPGLDIKSDLLEIIEIAKVRDGDKTDKYLEIINRIFYKMFAFNEKNIQTKPATKIRDYIDLHVTAPFSLMEIQELLGKSESQIIRTFKAAYGITPYAYHLEKRIEVAKTFLSTTSMRIREIADTLNFYDEYYFSNIFQKKTGMSPSQYRKKRIILEGTHEL